MMNSKKQLRNKQAEHQQEFSSLEARKLRYLWFPVKKSLFPPILAISRAGMIYLLFLRRHAHANRGLRISGTNQKLVQYKASILACLRDAFGLITSLRQKTESQSKFLPHAAVSAVLNAASSSLSQPSLFFSSLPFLHSSLIILIHSLLPRRLSPALHLQQRPPRVSRGGCGTECEVISLA